MRLPALCALPLLVGCSSVGTHPLTLVSPVATPCDTMANPNCTPTYSSCDDLGLKGVALRLQVGVFGGEVTTVPCPDDLQTGGAQVQVNYQPGSNFYMIDTSFPRDGMTVYIAAGPFPEDQPAQPWQVLLR
jgi:hypothetical protein